MTSLIRRSSCATCCAPSWHGSASSPSSLLSRLRRTKGWQKRLRHTPHRKRSRRSGCRRPARTARRPKHRIQHSHQARDRHQSRRQRVIRRSRRPKVIRRSRRPKVIRRSRRLKDRHRRGSSLMGSQCSRPLHHPSRLNLPRTTGCQSGYGAPYAPSWSRWTQVSWRACRAIVRLPRCLRSTALAFYRSFARKRTSRDARASFRWSPTRTGERPDLPFTSSTGL